MNLLRRLFLHNLGLKALSLLLAFLLWSQIARQQTVQRTVSVPVEFINMPANLEIANDYKKQVEVDIRSQRSTAAMEDRQLTAVINLEDTSPGAAVIPLSERNIQNRPSGVEILSINPARIRLQLERTSQKIVKVEPQIVGRPRQGYEITDKQVTPSEVMITGPESQVQEVSRAQTEPVNVDGSSSDVNLDVYVDLENPRLRIENTSSVEVSVVVEEERRQVQIASVPVQVTPATVPVRLLTQRVKVTGTVPVSFQGELKTSDFRARVNVEGLQPQSEPYEILPEIVPLPEYVHVFRLESVTPERVKVRKVR